jgi:hypothetical protein
VRFSPATIRQSIQKFWEDPHYCNKVLAKAESVRKDPVSVARALGVPDHGGDWDVRPLMVTGYVEPAAFVRNSPIGFCTVDDVVGFATRSQTGGHGPPKNFEDVRQCGEAVDSTGRTLPRTWSRRPSRSDRLG